MAIKVLGPDVNESFYKFAVNDKGEIRFGLGAIKGVGKMAVQAIVNERKENGNYTSFDDFIKRIDLRAANKRTLEGIAIAGGFDLFGFDLDYHDYFYHGGHLIDVKIPEEKVKQFIKKYELSLNTVADEFIKKIRQFEK